MKNSIPTNRAAYQRITQAEAWYLHQWGVDLMENAPVYRCVTADRVVYAARMSDDNAVCEVYARRHSGHEDYITAAYGRSVSEAIRNANAYMPYVVSGACGDGEDVNAVIARCVGHSVHYNDVDAAENYLEFYDGNACYTIFEPVTREALNNGSVFYAHYNGPVPSWF